MIQVQLRPETEARLIAEAEGAWDRFSGICGYGA